MTVTEEQFMSCLLDEDPKQYADVFLEKIPELRATVGFDQHHPMHDRDMWQHTLDVVAGVKPEKCLRMAALLHDIGKPNTFVLDEYGIGHCRGHVAESEHMAGTILEQFGTFSDSERESVCRLIHMHEAELPMSDKAMRRVARRMDGQVEDLVELWQADCAAKAPDAVKERMEMLEYIPAEFARVMKDMPEFMDPEDVAKRRQERYEAYLAKHPEMMQGYVLPDTEQEL